MFVVLSGIIRGTECVPGASHISPKTQRLSNYPRDDKVVINPKELVHVYRTRVFLTTLVSTRLSPSSNSLTLGLTRTFIRRNDYTILEYTYSKFQVSSWTLQLGLVDLTLQLCNPTQVQGEQYNSNVKKSKFKLKECQSMLEEVGCQLSASFVCFFLCFSALIFIAKPWSSCCN